MEADKLAMAIYLLALARMEATGRTYVAKELRATQQTLHESLGLSKSN